MDRIPSDHGSVRTVRVELARHGGRRLRVDVPAEAADQFPDGEVVRVSLDGQRRHARIDSHLTEDRPIVTGVYDGPDRARNPDDATDRLAEWIDAEGLEAGDPVLVDVVAEDFLYGLRVPGERVFYDDPDPPDSDLASIARDLEDRS
jgi:hypothetical protein